METGTGRMTGYAKGGEVEMTNQEAIETIKTAIAEVEWEYPMDYAAAFDMAVKALERQEAKPPRTKENAYGVKFYFCPRCGRPIIKSAVTGKPRHCEDCGQEVTWND